LSRIFIQWNSKNLPSFEVQSSGSKFSQKKPGSLTLCKSTGYNEIVPIKLRNGFLEIIMPFELPHTEVIIVKIIIRLSLIFSIVMLFNPNHDGGGGEIYKFLFLACYVFL